MQSAARVQWQMRAKIVIITVFLKSLRPECTVSVSNIRRASTGVSEFVIVTLNCK